MSNRIGVHYSSYVAAEGLRCIPFCSEPVTHWACSEFRGDKHHACQARCEKHRQENEPHTSYNAIPGLFVASYRIKDEPWAGSSVPMSLEDAKGFIIDAIDRAKLGPATAHEHERKVWARDAFQGTTRPLTFTVGMWEFRIDEHK